jgi:hypothetical protein
MRDCPHCRIAVDGPLCPKCGYSDSAAPVARTVPSSHFECAHEDRGQRCARYGSLTTNTHGDSTSKDRNTGHPGPWFCNQHFPPFLRWGSSTKVQPPDRFFASVRARLPRVIDPEEALERIAIQSEGDA